MALSMVDQAAKPLARPVRVQTFTICVSFFSAHGVVCPGSRSRFYPIAWVKPRISIYIQVQPGMLLSSLERLM